MNMQKSISPIIQHGLSRCLSTRTALNKGRLNQASSLIVWECCYVCVQRWRQKIIMSRSNEEHGYDFQNKDFRDGDTFLIHNVTSSFDRLDYFTMVHLFDAVSTAWREARRTQWRVSCEPHMLADKPPPPLFLSDTWTHGLERGYIYG